MVLFKNSQYDSTKKVVEKSNHLNGNEFLNYVKHSLIHSTDVDQEHNL